MLRYDHHSKYYSSGTYNWHRLYVLVPSLHPAFRLVLFKNAKTKWLYVPARKSQEFHRCHNYMCRGWLDANYMYRYCTIREAGLLQRKPKAQPRAKGTGIG